MPMAENSGDAYQIEKKITAGESEAYKAPKPREYRKVPPALKKEVDELVWRITQYETGKQDEAENRSALQKESARLHDAIVNSPLFQNTVLPQLQGAQQAGFPYTVERKYTNDYDVHSGQAIPLDAFDGFVLKATGGGFEDIVVDLDAQYNELFPEDANLEEETMHTRKEGESLTEAALKAFGESLENKEPWEGVNRKIDELLQREKEQREAAQNALKSAGLDIGRYVESFDSDGVTETVALGLAINYFKRDDPEDDPSAANRCRAFLEEARDAFLRVKPEIEQTRAASSTADFNFQEYVTSNFDETTARDIARLALMEDGQIPTEETITALLSGEKTSLAMGE